MKNLVGSTLGQLQIIEQLGRGGMANVYKAFHPGLAVYRAVKVIRPDLADVEGFRERFQREARAVAALRHPHIVQVHDFGQQDDLFFMVMEFVEGEDLKTRIRNEGAIRPIAEAIRITEQIGTALSYAHKQGVVHRDIKPDNVLLDRDGEVILADFGIAKIIANEDVKLTVTGTGIGTPGYMAPEQALGATNIGASADLYALGVVLYEMLTGVLPFAADTPLAVLQRVINDPVPPPRAIKTDIPEDLQNVVLRAMAKDPAARFKNVDELIRAARRTLDEIATGATVQTRVPATPPDTVGSAVGNGEMEAGTLAAAAMGSGASVATLPAAVVSQRTPSRWPLFALITILIVGFATLTGAAGFGVWWFAIRSPKPAAEAMSSLSPPGAATQEGDGGLAETSSAGASSAAVSSAAASSADSSPAESLSGSRLAESGPGTSTASAATNSSGRSQAAASAQVPAASEQGAEPQRSPPPPAPAFSEPWRGQRNSPGGSGARFLGQMRFGYSTEGEVEPEEPVEYQIEIRRPTTFYFDIVFQTRQAVYTLLDSSGHEIFKSEGADQGPITLEKKGQYRLRIETTGNVTVGFEIQFLQIGS